MSDRPPIARYVPFSTLSPTDTAAGSGSIAPSRHMQSILDKYASPARHSTVSSSLGPVSPSPGRFAPSSLLFSPIGSSAASGVVGSPHAFSRSNVTSTLGEPPTASPLGSIYSRSSARSVAGATQLKSPERLLAEIQAMRAGTAGAAFNSTLHSPSRWVSPLSSSFTAHISGTYAPLSSLGSSLGPRLSESLPVSFSPLKFQLPFRSSVVSNPTMAVSAAETRARVEATAAADRAAEARAVQQAEQRFSPRTSLESSLRVSSPVVSPSRSSAPLSLSSPLTRLSETYAASAALESEGDALIRKYRARLLERETDANGLARQSPQQHESMFAASPASSFASAQQPRDAQMVQRSEPLVARTGWLNPSGDRFSIVLNESASPGHRLSSFTLSVRGHHAEGTAVQSVPSPSADRMTRAELEEATMQAHNAEDTEATDCGFEESTDHVPVSVTRMQPQAQAQAELFSPSTLAAAVPRTPPPSSQRVLTSTRKTGERKYASREDASDPDDEADDDADTVRRQLHESFSSARQQLGSGLDEATLARNREVDAARAREIAALAAGTEPVPEMSEAEFHSLLQPWEREIEAELDEDEKIDYKAQDDNANRDDRVAAEMAEESVGVPEHLRTPFLHNDDTTVAVSADPSAHLLTPQQHAQLVALQQSYDLADSQSASAGALLSPDPSASPEGLDLVQSATFQGYLRRHELHELRENHRRGMDGSIETNAEQIDQLLHPASASQHSTDAAQLGPWSTSTSHHVSPRSSMDHTEAMDASPPPQSVGASSVAAPSLSRTDRRVDEQHWSQLRQMRLTEPSPDPSAAGSPSASASPLAPSILAMIQPFSEQHQQLPPSAHPDPADAAAERGLRLSSPAKSAHSLLDPHPVPLYLDARAVAPAGLSVPSFSRVSSEESASSDFDDAHSALSGGGAAEAVLRTYRHATRAMQQAQPPQQAATDPSTAALSVEHFASASVSKLQSLRHQLLRLLQVQPAQFDRWRDMQQQVASQLDPALQRELDASLSLLHSWPFHPASLSRFSSLLLHFLAVDCGWSADLLDADVQQAVRATVEGIARSLCEDQHVDAASNKQPLSSAHSAELHRMDLAGFVSRFPLLFRVSLLHELECLLRDECAHAAIVSQLVSSYRSELSQLASTHAEHTRRLTQEILNEMVALEQDQRADLDRMRQERAQKLAIIADAAIPAHPSESPKRTTEAEEPSRTSGPADERREADDFTANAPKAPARSVATDESEDESDVAAIAAATEAARQQQLSASSAEFDDLFPVHARSLSIEDDTDVARSEFRVEGALSPPGADGFATVVLRDAAATVVFDEAAAEAWEDDEEEEEEQREDEEAASGDSASAPRVTDAGIRALESPSDVWPLVRSESWNSSDADAEPTEPRRPPPRCVAGKEASAPVPASSQQVPSVCVSRVHGSLNGAPESDSSSDESDSSSDSIIGRIMQHHAAAAAVGRAAAPPLSVSSAAVPLHAVPALSSSPSDPNVAYVRGLLESDVHSSLARLRSRAAERLAEVEAENDEWNQHRIQLHDLAASDAAQPVSDFAVASAVASAARVRSHSRVSVSSGDESEEAAAMMRSDTHDDSDGQCAHDTSQQGARRTEERGASPVFALSDAPSSSVAASSPRASPATGQRARADLQQTDDSHAAHGSHPHRLAQSSAAVSSLPDSPPLSFLRVAPERSLALKARFEQEQKQFDAKYQPNEHTAGQMQPRTSHNSNTRR